MFGFLKKIKGAGAELANKSVKAENKDLMEAMVCAAALMAYADGELEDEEVTKISQILDTSKALEAFGTEPAQFFDAQCKILDSSYRMGRLTIMKEIEDVKGNKDESEMVMIMAIEVAFADGEMEPEEEKELNAIAGKLGLRLGDYLQVIIMTFVFAAIGVVATAAAIAWAWTRSHDKDRK